jgi:hypothetical protein
VVRERVGREREREKMEKKRGKDCDRKIASLRLANALISINYVTGLKKNIDRLILN